MPNRNTELRLVQSVSIGVVVGLTAVFIHELVSNEEVVETIRTEIESIIKKVSSNKKEMTEEDAVHRARQEGNPAINQQWVEQQWEAVLR